ncbi:MAG: hypothetical protein ACI88C_002537 [Acidimicrobiales bacterium]|jgi:hypothetical protein
MMFSLGSHLRKLVSRSLFRLHKSLRVIACGSVRQVAARTMSRRHHLKPRGGVGGLLIQGPT